MKAVSVKVGRKDGVGKGEEDGGGVGRGVLVVDMFEKCERERERGNELVERERK